MVREILDNRSSYLIAFGEVKGGEGLTKLKSMKTDDILGYIYYT